MKASQALAGALLGVSLMIPVAAYAADAADGLPVFDFSFSDESAINELAPTQIEMVVDVAPPAGDIVIVDEATSWQLAGLKQQLSNLEGAISNEADIAQAAMWANGQVAQATDPTDPTDPTGQTVASDGTASQTSSTTVTAYVHRSIPKAEVSYARRLDVNGTPVNYVDVSAANVVPDTGGGLWRGSDSTTDGSWGYFVGHNPGSFACVMDLVQGNPVTVWDSKGNSRTYTVVSTFDVPDTTMWEDLQPQISTYGESVIMQTCNGDDLYRIVVAR